MKKGYFVAAVVGAFVIGFYIGCGDEMLPAAEGAQRIVVEVSEANLTGNGGYVDIPVVNVGTEGNGGRDMASVVVYGSGYGQNNRWRMITGIELSQGKVKIDPNEYGSFYYRVVVVH